MVFADVVCQCKFLVFKYSAKISAKMPFMAVEISLVAAAFKSVGVTSGAAWRSFIVTKVGLVGFSDLVMVRSFK